MSETFFQCKNMDHPCYKAFDRCELSKSELLMNTILAGHNDCAESLIKMGLDVNLKVCRSQTTVMNIAAKYGNHYVLKLLIEAGADVNLTDRYGESPLMFAAANNNDRCIDILIQAGADVNKRNNIRSNALMKATGTGYCKLLIAHGPDQVQEAFVAAIKECRTDSVRQILQSGADVNLKEFGPKYMHEAISSGNVACVQLFIEAGVDVNNVVNICCNSALLSAVSSKEGVNDQMISLLIGQGAHVNRENERGQIALAYYIAESYRTGSRVNKRLALLLSAAGEILHDKRVICYGTMWDKNWGVCQVDVPFYLLPKRFQWNEEERTICLKEFCRETIRKHLREIDNHSNFLMRIPKIGLPPSLQRFLLYDLNLNQHSEMLIRGALFIAHDKIFNGYKTKFFQ